MTAKSAESQALPDDRPVSISTHRVGFYQTDAMGIVHHANYAHFLENARILYLEEHDVAYQEYMAMGFNFAVTKLEVQYRQAAHFDDRIDTHVRLEWVRGASIGMTYELRRGNEIIATAATEHALVDEAGKPSRLPADRRAHLQTLVGR